MQTEIEILTQQLQEKITKIEKMYDEYRKLQALEDNARRTIELLHRDMEQRSQQRKAQLMSIFYTLNQLAKVGTHHEKEVVIRYLKLNIEHLVKDDNFRLPSDDLPF